MSSGPAEVRAGQLEHRLEEEWQARLRILEQWVSKLLIKNEQLRMSLASAKAPKQEEGDDTSSRLRQRASQADEP